MDIVTCLFLATSFLPLLLPLSLVRLREIVAEDSGKCLDLGEGSQEVVLELAALYYHHSVLSVGGLDSPTDQIAPRPSSPPQDVTCELERCLESKNLSGNLHLLPWSS